MKTLNASLFIRRKLCSSAIYRNTEKRSASNACSRTNARCMNALKRNRSNGKRETVASGYARGEIFFFLSVKNRKYRRNYK